VLYYGLKRFNSKGVPTDWATHMIGHELTALYVLITQEHFAVGPNLYRVMFETKKGN
jgi:NADP-dependent alcohol dehydrogenase